MKYSKRIGVALGACAVVISGAAAVAPAAEAKTRVAQVLEFELDPVTTRLVASDPARAVTDLALRTPFLGDGWFTALTVRQMGQSVRESHEAKPCLVGFTELSSNDTTGASAWTVVPSCDRVVPEFRQVTRRTTVDDKKSSPLIAMTADRTPGQS